MSGTEATTKEDLKEIGLLNKDGSLSEMGIRLLRGLLERVLPLPKIPKDLFLPIMGKVVPVAIEVVLIRDGEVYLTWRDDEFFRGWHVPGTYICPGEAFLQTAQRCADREMSGITILDGKVIDTVNHPDSPRFHDFSVITVCPFRGEPEQQKGRWFLEWPEDLIEVHQPYKNSIDRYRGR